MMRPQQYSDGECNWRIGCRRTQRFYYQLIPFCRGLHSTDRALYVGLPDAFCKNIDHFVNSAMPDLGCAVIRKRIFKVILE